MTNNLFNRDLGHEHRVKKRFRDYDVPFFHRLLIMLMSSLLAFSSFFPLFFKGLATSLQSQNYYIGWAFSRQQLPYAHAFSREGFLYHTLSAIANHYGGSHWLILGQLFAFYVAGIYLYKLIQLLTKQSGLGLKGVGLFYLFQLAFGFGGLYSIQLATPFILFGLWLAVMVWNDYHKDEVFIAQGLAAAISLALAPITLTFWSLLVVTTVVVNFRKRLWGKGVYQALASIFGAVLFLYPIAYFVFNFQLAAPYLEQAFLSQFVLDLSFTLVSYLSMGGLILVCAGSGLLTGVLLLPIYVRKMAEQRAILVLLSLSTVAYLMLAVLTQRFGFDQVLLILPFGLLLTLISLSQLDDAIKSPTGLSRRLSAQARVHFQRRHLYLPLLLAFGSLIWTGYQFLVNQPLVVERQRLAVYLLAESEATTKISAWDNSAQLYLDSQLLSATQFPVVTVNTASPSGKSLLEDQFLQGGASYLIINRSLALPSSLEKKLQETYEKVDLSGLSHFVLYRAK